MALPDLLQPTGRADVGVFGGSGFYSLMEGPVEVVTVQTPYGAPSDDLMLGRMGDLRVAFLPRHGHGHRIPPHAINYRANVWAMAQLGVTRLIAPTAAGSLQPRIKPGDFVVHLEHGVGIYRGIETIFVGQSTIFSLTDDQATGEAYCLAHHVTIDGVKRRLMVASLRYLDTFVKRGGAWLFAERKLYVDWLEKRTLS